MPGALSYLTVRPPEALSYGAPSVDFSPIGNLNKTAREGEQYARLRSLQQPILDENGQPSTNIDTISRELLKRGGAESAQQLLPILLGQQYLQRYGGGVQQFPEVDQGNARQPQRQPGSIGTHPYGPEAAGQPALSSAGTDNKGADSLSSLAGTVFGENDATPQIKTVAAKLGVDPADELTPTQINQAKYLFGLEKSKLASTSPNAPIGGPQAPQVAPQAAAQPQPPMQVAQAGQAPQSPAMALVPKGVRDPGAYADALDKSAAQILAGAAQQATAAGYAKVPFSPAPAEQEARRRSDLAKQIREALAKEAQTKLETGQAVEKKGAELDLERGQKAYEGIHGQAITYQQEQKPFNDLARSILNDPNMYSGIGADRKLDLEKIASNIFGGDHTKAAALMEALQKVTASSMLQQMNSTREQMIAAGSNAGRMFKDQTQAVKDASPQLATTKWGNRFLVEVQDRNGRLATRVDDMMQDYLAKHNLRYPDKGFDRELTAYLKSHAIFTPEELANPHYLGAPSMPQQIFNMPKSPERTAAYIKWGRSLGLERNDPVRLPDGSYRVMP